MYSPRQIPLLGRVVRLLLPAPFRVVERSLNRTPLDADGFLPLPFALALRRPLGAAAALLLGCAIGAPAAHARVQELGLFENWRAYVSEDGGSKQCFARSEPVESKGKYKERGKPAITVSHRPKDKVRNEVSVMAGYVFKPQSKVEVEIGKKKFFLFVDQDAAWAEEAKVDEALVQEMGRGSKLVVKGVSSRGTETVDTYSLKGSKAALRAISQACGIR